MPRGRDINLEDYSRLCCPIHDSALLPVYELELFTLFSLLSAPPRPELDYGLLEFDR